MVGVSKICSRLRLITSSGTQNFTKRDMSSIQEKHLSEQCICVDELDRPLKQISKRDCHRADTMILHRAFSVFLFTSGGSLLMQKRSKNKITFPSVWTNSCCSHPLWTESELCDQGRAIGVRRAAQRKLRHELGIDTISLDRMHVMGRFIYKAMSDGHWGEYEMDYAVVVPNFDDSSFTPNPEEVEQIAYVNQEELNIWMKNKEAFSPWFSMLMKNEYLYKWWNNLDHLAVYQDLKTICKLN